MRGCSQFAPIRVYVNAYRPTVINFGVTTLRVIPPGGHRAGNLSYARVDVVKAELGILTALGRAAESQSDAANVSRVITLPGNDSYPHY